MICHINKMENKSHMISIIEKGMAFDKKQHSFVIKILHKTGIEGTYRNIIEAVYDKLTPNIMLNSEKLKLFF